MGFLLPQGSMYLWDNIVDFIASGYSAHKYFSIGNREDEDAPMNEREPSYLQVAETLFRYHWGTVVGGALILPYFYFVDLLLDFIFVSFG